MLLSAGQDGDNPMLEPLLKAHQANQVPQLGRLLADKAYSRPSTRARLRALKIKHTIPERSDQIARRKAKGSAGGRPPSFDPRLYRNRNTVERGFNRLSSGAASPPGTTNTP
jgi:transposase